MHAHYFIIFVTFFTCFQQIKSVIRPVLINQFNIPHVTAVTLVRSWVLNSTSMTLMITTNDVVPTSTDYIYTVPSIQWYITTNITAQLVTNQIYWPNTVVPADPIVPYSIIVPSGYFVPSKTNGNIYFIGSDNKPIALAPTEKTNWFYHDVAFKDVDMDGYTDIVTGRANVPLVHDPQTELVWLKNPGQMNITGPWNVSILMPEGGSADLQGRSFLFANSFFTRKLQLIWSLDEPRWNDASKIRLRHISNNPLQYYFLRYTTDLNGDQIPDLLATVSNGFNGLLLAYELPPAGEMINGTFKEHILAGGFKPTDPAIGRISPGKPTPYQFYSLTDRKKPIILLSGADDGCVYLLEAVHDNDPTDWQYYMTTVYNSTGMSIGDICIDDVDNDGHPELFIPATNEGKVLIYRLMNDGN